MCYNYSKESDIIVLSCILGFVKQILKFFYFDNLTSYTRMLKVKWIKCH